MTKATNTTQFPSVEHWMSLELTAPVLTCPYRLGLPLDNTSTKLVPAATGVWRLFGIFMFDSCIDDLTTRKHDYSEHDMKFLKHLSTPI